jgi:hypothetical protein
MGVFIDKEGLDAAGINNEKPENDQGDFIVR